MNDNEEECEQQNESLRDEINNYLCTKTLNTEHILYFWKNNAIKYSKLAKVAKIVLSVLRLNLSPRETLVLVAEH